MNFSRAILVALAFPVAFSLSSCKEDDGILTDTEAPVIDFMNPAEGALFNSGDDISVEFRITENDELHAWSLEMRRASDDSLLAEIGEHEHVQLLDVTAMVSATVAAVSECTLIAIAEDHTGNEARVERSIRIQP